MMVELNEAIRAQVDYEWMATFVLLVVIGLIISFIGAIIMDIIDWLDKRKKHKDE
jgi:uncharacterized membrane protein